MMLPFLVFTLAIILDVVWAQYIVWVMKKHPLNSALFNSGIVLTNSILTILYVSDPFLMLANVLGAFVGTFLIVTWQRSQI